MQRTFPNRLMFNIFLAIVLALSAFMPHPVNASVSLKTRDALLAGELVIYFRHGATTWMGIDRIEWPREKQRLLSQAGIAQSKLIGQQIQRIGAPIGDVMASPFARCRDMAEIAFGRVDERSELLGLLSDAQGRPTRVAFLLDLVSSPTNGDGNRIIVSHRSNIQNVAGSSLEEGEAVLIRPLGGEKFEVLETLMPEDWALIDSP